MQVQECSRRLHSCTICICLSGELLNPPRLERNVRVWERYLKAKLPTRHGAGSDTRNHTMISIREKLTAMQASQRMTRLEQLEKLDSMFPLHPKRLLKDAIVSSGANLNIATSLLEDPEDGGRVALDMDMD